MNASGNTASRFPRKDGVPSKRWQLRHGVNTVDTALPSLSPPALADLLGRPDAPLLLDVRRPERFAESAWMLPGALHCPPAQVPGFARSRRAQAVVVYCAHGHEISREAAGTLRAAGWDARVLEGGIDGPEAGVDSDAALQAWRAAPPPRMRKRPELGVTGEQPSRWITRARPKIDRIACPWLILRFIDPRAEFLYVAKEEVFARARELVAVPYDLEGAPIGHEGDRCSFDALLRAFALQDAALDRLATIVRGADTDRLHLAPQAAGLLAISLGLSHLHADDHAMLQAAVPVYDALFAWCRSYREETHGRTVHAEAAR
jgi:rhodanese-related sulfurtransferase